MKCLPSYSQKRDWNRTLRRLSADFVPGYLRIMQRCRLMQAISDRSKDVVHTLCVSQAVMHKQADRWMDNRPDQGHLPTNLPDLPKGQVQNSHSHRRVQVPAHIHSPGTDDRQSQTAGYKSNNQLQRMHAKWERMGHSKAKAHMQEMATVENNKWDRRSCKQDTIWGKGMWSRKVMEEKGQRKEWKERQLHQVLRQGPFQQNPGEVNLQGLKPTPRLKLPEQGKSWKDRGKKRKEEGKMTVPKVTARIQSQSRIYQQFHKWFDESKRAKGKLWHKQSGIMVIKMLTLDLGFLAQSAYKVIRINAIIVIPIRTSNTKGPHCWSAMV